MPSTTFLDLCQRLRAEAGVQGTGPAAVTGQTGLYARLVEWTQVAYREILRMHPWSFLWARATKDTSNGVATYTPTGWSLPQMGCVYAGRIYDTTTTGRPRLAYRDFVTLDQMQAASGPPRLFARRPDGGLQLYPTPDGVYSLQFDYLREGHSLANNTDEPLIPDVMLRDAIVYRALGYYALYNEDPAAKVQADVHFNQRLSEMHALYGQKIITAAIPLDVPEDVHANTLELV